VKSFITHMTAAGIAVMLCIPHLSHAAGKYPILHYTKKLPRAQRTALAKEGFDMDRVKSVIAWELNGVRHYFVAVNDIGGGCGIIDISDAGSSKILDSYGQCRILGAPRIADLSGDGNQGIVVKLRVNSNGAAPAVVEQVNGYLYVKSASEFCRNNDAGSFANGTRVPNSVLKYSASICR
jgi:hypothetical protein